MVQPNGDHIVTLLLQRIARPDSAVQFRIHPAGRDGRRPLRLVVRQDRRASPARSHGDETDILRFRSSSRSRTRPPRSPQCLARIEPAACEIMVVDGGSEDETRAIAEAAGCRHPLLSERASRPADEPGRRPGPRPDSAFSPRRHLAAAPDALDRNQSSDRSARRRSAAASPGAIARAPSPSPSLPASPAAQPALRLASRRPGAFR